MKLNLKKESFKINSLSLFFLFFYFFIFLYFYYLKDILSYLILFYLPFPKITIVMVFNKIFISNKIS